VAFEQVLSKALLCMPKKHKHVLNAVLKYNADNKELYFSQVKLAAKLKLGLSTIKRALARFKELGIIQWVFRGVKKTCLYTLSPFFHSKALRDKFVALVSGFKYIPMTLLLSSNAHLYTSGNTRPVASGPQCTNVENLNIKSLSLKEVSLEAVRSISIRESLGIPSSARAYEENETKRNEIKKEKDCSMYSPSLSIAAALDVKSIKLTEYGRLVVGVYPDKAIEAADNETKKMRGMKNPMAFFLSHCKKHCEANGLRLNYNRLNEFKNSNPGWENLSEYEAITPQPEPEVKGKSGTSGILKPGVKLPTFEEVSARIKARNAAERNESIADQQEKSGEFRDPKTFDRLGEWTKFVLEGKRRLAAGEPVNPFWQREIDQYDKAQAAGADMTDIPVKSLNALTGGNVVDPVILLPAQKRQALAKVLEHKDILGNTESALVLVTQIKELLQQGIAHRLAEYKPFWEGIYHIVSVITEQEDLQSATLDYRLDGSLDSTVRVV
jgi:hypothetical protein